MNTRALRNIVVALGVGTACLTSPACSTSTPIGVVGGNTGGASGGQADQGAPDAMGTGGMEGAATGSGGGGSPAPVPPGHYVPSEDQVLTDPSFTNPTAVADWVGYLENYDLYYTGSDQLHLHFGADAQGNATLSVVRGMGAPPAPPTDPYQKWPDPDLTFTIPDVPYPDMPVAGFAYGAHGVSRQDARLKFFTLDAEPWTTWCNLQTSYPSGQGSYGCDLNDSISPHGNDTCQFGAHPDARCIESHWLICGMQRVCICNDTGCGSSIKSTSSYDITFFSDHALGSMGNYNLILTPVML